MVQSLAPAVKHCPMEFCLRLLQTAQEDLCRRRFRGKENGESVMRRIFMIALFLLTRRSPLSLCGMRPWQRLRESAGAFLWWRSSFGTSCTTSYYFPCACSAIPNFWTRAWCVVNDDSQECVWGVVWGWWDVWEWWFDRFADLLIVLWIGGWSRCCCGI